MKKGISLYKQKMFDEAITEFTKAIQTNPRYARAYYDRGVTYLDKNLYEEAISDFSKVVDIKPKFVIDAYYNRGLAYNKKGLYDLAISDYSNVIKINPKDIEAYLNRAFAYEKRGLYNQAISDYKEVIKLKPKDTKVLISLGLAYDSVNQPQQAIAHFQEALKTDNNNANTYYALGLVYSKLNNYHEAKENFRRAKELWQAKDDREGVRRVTEADTLLDEVSRRKKIQKPIEGKALAEKINRDSAEIIVDRNEKILKIGISYDQVMKALSDIFVMEKSTPVKGEERYMGRTADGLAVLEIIGDKENITKTTLLLTTPKDAPDIIKRNSMITVVFVANLFPGQEKEVSDWTASAMDKLAYSDLETEEKFLDNKKVTVRKMLPLGIGITVESAQKSLALPHLEVNGVFYEEKGQSYAIVNEEVVKVGNKIAGVEVIEIGKDSVKFKYGNDFFVKKSGEGVSSEKERISSVPVQTKDLSLEVRKKIFYETCEAENRAIIEVETKYPYSSTLNIEEVREKARNRNEMRFDLMRKYRKEVWDKYNISEEQGVEIGVEGIEKHWPTPPLESPW